MNEARIKSISVGTALSRAWERMMLVGFKPFDFVKWLTLGFAMFLTSLWASVSQFGQNMGRLVPAISPAPWPSPSNATSFAAYIQAHGQTLALLGLVLGLVTLIVYALTTFFACRGQFMMIQSLAENEAKIVQPWSQWAEQANSVFWFKVVVALVAGLLMALTLAIAGWIVWPNIQSGVPTDRSVWTASLGIPWMLMLIVAWWNVLIVTDDFIVPMMYAQPMDAWTAWGIWLREFLPGHIWALTLFYLMRFALVMALGAVTATVTCLTLCLAAIPYISSVVFMPLSALDRCFAYYFVEQFGPRWAIFRRETDQPTCQACGYDLRGNPAALTCPECGTAIPRLHPT